MSGEHMKRELNRRGSELKEEHRKEKTAREKGERGDKDNPSDRELELQAEMDQVRRDLEFLNARPKDGSLPPNSDSATIAIDGKKKSMVTKADAGKQKQADLQKEVRQLERLGEVQTNVLLGATERTDTKLDKQKEMLETYFDSIKKDADATKLENRMIALAATIFGIAGLILQIVGWQKPVPSPSPSPAPTPTPSPSSNVSAAADGLTTMLSSTHEFSADGKKAIQVVEDLVAASIMVGDGLIDHHEILKIFAEHAHTLTVDDQVTALVFLANAAIDQSETRAFFWLDPTHMNARIDQLHQAYQARKDFSDVYREAQKLQYDNKDIPFFQTSSIIQFALALVENENAPA
ncbi:hypothetical protein [Paraburkholderia caribensis]|nr:hypothetical protein [Paraburkholderia caribensis]